MSRTQHDSPETLGASFPYASQGSPVAASFLELKPLQGEV